MTTRRTFLSASSLAALAAVRRPLWRPAATLLRPSASPRAADPDLHALAMRALDAAKTAGATYADIRFTLTRRRRYENGNSSTDSDAFAAGVRVLSKGAWGFAGATDWTPDGVTKLARKAADQAEANAWPRVPPIELGERPPVVTGHWQTPITRDPFTVPPKEVNELIQTVGAKVAGGGKGGAKMLLVFTFECQERTFASTDGSYTTQTVYTAFGGSPHTDTPPSQFIIAPNGGQDHYEVPGISPRGAGYEAVEALGIFEHLPEWLDKAQAIATARPFPTLGEFDVVFDGYAMASLVNGTFGAALEYDRAVGYEANAGGTSYLAPPAKILGTSWAPAPVTITADRTMPGGAATVRWDDEGIAPQPTPLVKAGVVVDYATSREFVPELAGWYRTHGHSLRSNGDSASESALTVPLVHTPNLVLHPGNDATHLETLLSGIENGFAIFGERVTMDFQQLTGLGRGALVYAVRHGKLAEPVRDVAHTFKSKELWQNLVALGGASTAVSHGLVSSKGQPDQYTMHTVNAVAARFEKVRLQPANQV